MLLEERDYRIRAGFLGDFVDLYMNVGLPIQRAHLGEPIGFFTSEIGELNHFVSIWRWEDMADRATRRALMLADAGWPDYLASIKGLAARRRTIHPPAITFRCRRLRPSVTPVLMWRP